MTHAINPSTINAEINSGLEGLVVAETALSHVDGTAGELIFRGRPIDELAGAFPFEAVVHHLWSGYSDLDPAQLSARFGEARRAAWKVVPVLQSAPRTLGVYELMRLGLDSLPVTDDDMASIMISGALPVFLAAGFRISTGEQPIEPQTERSLAEDLLQMLKGQPAAPHEIAALDRYLVTILDHGLNASTFTARVISSTRASMRSAVSGAMGALKGPLHGGAPGPVLDMLDAVGSPENANAWVAGELAAGKRLMGFGHRVYRTRDPRTDVLKDGLKTLPQDSPRLRLAEAVETAAIKALSVKYPDRKLDTNVEFYTAVLLDGIGIDKSLFTPLFAVGRTPGWCAHVMEQRATGRLIRPAARYVGP